MHWEDLAQPIPHRPNYRIWVTAGRILPRFAVTAELRPDDAIELLELSLDLDAGWD